MISDDLAAILDRLDQGVHVTPSRVELSRDNGEWVAQIMADPLHEPIVGRGPYMDFALAKLLEHKIDWRRVRRRRP
jgi:hypothetical protein